MLGKDPDIIVFDKDISLEEIKILIAIRYPIIKL